MDSLEQAAKYWRTKLQAGQPIYRVRVRKLLELRGAERRGSSIMAGIRRTLESYGLVTEPDFQSVWPESLVAVKLRLEAANTSDGEPRTTVGDNSAGQVAAPSQAEPVDTLVDPQVAADLESDAGEPEEAATKEESLNSPVGDAGLVEVGTSQDLDPLIRISSIPSAKGGVATILPDDSLKKATTLMMFHGYSQLAIMQGDREVRGLISWESIAKRSLSEPPPKLVRDCRIDALVIDIDASLHDAVSVIWSHGCVLVRSRDKKITGIVTGSDLSSEFARSSYAFMCIRTIEIIIRGKLHPCVTPADLDTLEEHSRARVEGDASSLTFGENVRLLQDPAIWQRLGLGVDRAEVTKRLLEIREIRNEVMHFGEPVNEVKKAKLEQMEAFLKQVVA